MSRLINADGLKRAVVELGEDVVLCDSCFCEFMDLIDVQPTIDAMPMWVSVKDKLPKLNEDVLVYAVGKEEEGFGEEHATAICHRYVLRLFPTSLGNEVWSEPWRYFHTDYEITHWMPLPEHPNEVSE